MAQATGVLPTRERGGEFSSTATAVPRKRRHGHVPDGQLELGFVEASAGARPVLGSELEVPIAGPVRQNADDVGEVSLGVEAVQDHDAMREKMSAAA